MEKEIDIHYYNKKLETIIKSIKNSLISEKNKEILLRFQDSCFSESIGKAKITRYLYDLKKIAEILMKDFDVCKREDLQKAVAEIEKMDYAYETKRGFRIALKKFYKWLKNSEDTYPEEVRWVKTTADNSKKRLPEDLLNEEEILNLIKNANKIRDKAFIACLYESGCRVGELATIKIRNVEFDNYGAKIIVSGKTGSRLVRLVSSAPYLQGWLNEHFDNKNPDAYIWLSQKRELLSYGRIKDMLRDTAKKANIKKAINPHSFRHARATYLAKRLSEAQLKAVMGWTQGSKMSAIYVHLSQRDTEDAILELNGITRAEKENSKIKLNECPRCHNKNNKPTDKFCGECSMILDREEADKIIKADFDKQKINELMNQLLQDSEFKELIKKKLNLS